MLYAGHHFAWVALWVSYKRGGISLYRFSWSGYLLHDLALLPSSKGRELCSPCTGGTTISSDMISAHSPARGREKTRTFTYSKDLQSLFLLGYNCGLHWLLPAVAHSHDTPWLLAQRNGNRRIVLGYKTTQTIMQWHALRICLKYVFMAACAQLSIVVLLRALNIYVKNKIPKSKLLNYKFKSKQRDFFIFQILEMTSTFPSLPQASGRRRRPAERNCISQ